MYADYEPDIAHTAGREAHGGQTATSRHKALHHLTNSLPTVMMANVVERTVPVVIAADGDAKV